MKKLTLLPLLLVTLMAACGQPTPEPATKNQEAAPLPSVLKPEDITPELRKPMPGARPISTPAPKAPDAKDLDNAIQLQAREAATAKK